jgi:hypothetical protein
MKDTKEYEIFRKGRKLSMGKPTGKRALGRRRSRWEVILKRILKKQDERV